MVWRVSLLVLVLCALAACGPVAPDPAPSPGSPASTAAKAERWSAGTYTVGGNIKAGTYTTPGTTDDLPCYWARLHDFEGAMDSTISNNLFEGPGRVTVRSTDKGLELTGSCVWRRA